MMAEDKQEVATEQQQQQEPTAAATDAAAVQNGDNKPANGDAPVTNGTTNGTTTTEETPNVEPVKEMRSIIVSAFGSGSKSLKVLKKPEPAQPGDGEVLIRVQSA